MEELAKMLEKGAGRIRNLAQHFDVTSLDDTNVKEVMMWITSQYDLMRKEQKNE